MPQNVLLMLSTAAPPPPVQEVQWHAAHCASHGSTHLVTTHTLDDLVAGESVVAFYGDAALGNRYLGRGIYLGYTDFDSPPGQALLAGSPLYSTHGTPATSRGFVELRDVVIASAGEDLGSLNGIIRASGLPLTLANIPDGPSRSRVYYLRGSSTAKAELGAVPDPAGT